MLAELERHGPDPAQKAVPAEAKPPAIATTGHRTVVRMIECRHVSGARHRSDGIPAGREHRGIDGLQFHSGLSRKKRHRLGSWS